MTCRPEAARSRCKAAVAAEGAARPRGWRPEVPQAAVVQPVVAKAEPVAMAAEVWQPLHTTGLPVAEAVPTPADLTAVRPVLAALAALAAAEPPPAESAAAEPPPAASAAAASAVVEPPPAALVVAEPPRAAWAAVASPLGSLGGGGAPLGSLGCSGAPPPPPTFPPQRMARITETQAENVVMCDSFLELVTAQGKWQSHVAEVEAAIQHSFPNTAVMGFPGEGVDRMIGTATKLKEVVNQRGRKYQVVVIISLGNDLVKGKELKSKADEWAMRQGPLMRGRAVLLGDLVGQIAHRSLIVYGGEADKWGGLEAVREKRWKVLDRAEYDNRVMELKAVFESRGATVTTGAKELKPILTGKSDIGRCGGSTDSWHFSWTALPTLVDVVQQWLTQAQSSMPPPPPSGQPAPAVGGPLGPPPPPPEPQAAAAAKPPPPTCPPPPRADAPATKPEAAAAAEPPPPTGPPPPRADAPATKPKAAAAAEPPAPPFPPPQADAPATKPKAAVTAEPPAQPETIVSVPHEMVPKLVVKAEPPSSQGGDIDPDLARFLGEAEQAASQLRGLFDPKKSACAVAGQIAMEATAFCSHLRSISGLPIQIHAFQGNINRVAWCA